MREIPVEFQTIINSRTAVCARTFLTFKAKNRDTGEFEYLGLWTGGDVYEFTIEGQTMPYYGGACIVDLGELENSVGTDINSYRLNLSSLADPVITVLRQYNPKGAEVKIHAALFDVNSGLQATPFVRRFKGRVDKAKIKTPEKNARLAGSVEMSLVSVSRNTTVTVPSRKSHENQKQRDPDDDFFQYVAASGTVQTPWGADRAGEDSKSLGGVISKFMKKATPGGSK